MSIELATARIAFFAPRRLLMRRNWARAGSLSFFRVAAHVALISVGLSQGALCRVRVERRLPALSAIAQALLLLREASHPGPIDRTLVGGIGGLYVGVGLFDACLTRGKHLGWPLLTAIGVFSLFALLAA